MDPRLNDTFGVRYATQQLDSGRFVAKAFVRRDGGAGKAHYEFDFEQAFDTAEEALNHARENLNSRLLAADRGD